MSHLLKESPDDEPETPEPSAEFVDEWLADRWVTEDIVNRDELIDENIEEINAAWEKHLHRNYAPMVWRK